MILNVIGMLKLMVDSILSNFEWLHEVEVSLLYIACWIVSGLILEFDELHVENDVYCKNG